MGHQKSCVSCQKSPIFCQKEPILHQKNHIFCLLISTPVDIVWGFHNTNKWAIKRAVFHVKRARHFVQKNQYCINKALSSVCSYQPRLILFVGLTSRTDGPSKELRFMSKNRSLLQNIVSFIGLLCKSAKETYVFGNLLIVATSRYEQIGHQKSCVSCQKSPTFCPKKKWCIKWAVSSVCRLKIGLI